MRLNYSRLLFVFYNIALFFALVLSVINDVIIISLIILSTYFLIYIPSVFELKKRRFDLNGIEVLILVLIYFVLFLNNFYFGTTELIYRIIKSMIISVSVSLLGFILIYFFLKEKSLILKTDSKFLALFTFCFSFTIVTLWQVFRYVMDYIFEIQIGSYSVSGAFGFVSVHSVGSFLIGIFAYLFLVGDDKYQIRKLLKKIFNIRSGRRSSKQKIIDLIGIGEDELCEFKETLRTNIFTNQHDKKMELTVLKTIVAFLNSKGGTLLVGVSDKGEITGIERDNFKNEDKCRLHLVNIIKSHIGTNFISNVKIEVVNISERLVLIIEVYKSKTPVFLKHGKDEEFYVRTGPASIQLLGKELLDYTFENFNKKK